MIDRTAEELMPIVLLGISVIGLGIYLSNKYKKNYDGIKTINIKYNQNNKEQKAGIYSSKDENNVEAVYSELKNKIS
jgi:hypothetical protein